MSTLDQLEALLAQGTPGPWRAWTDFFDGSPFGYGSVTRDQDTVGSHVLIAKAWPHWTEHGGGDEGNNAALIAAAVNSLPDLLAVARASDRVLAWPRRSSEWHDAADELARILARFSQEPSS